MNAVQKCAADILSEIQKICEEHCIPYYAIGGTCLGAVRHQGFIPWDDDIDIAIPIEYYFEFQKIAKMELPSYLELYTCDTSRHFPRIFCKVIDKRTTFIETAYIRHPDSYAGVFVDIMPMSGIPSPGYLRMVFYLKLAYYNNMNYFRRTDPDMVNKWHKKIFCLVLNMFKRLIPYNRYSNKWYKLLMKHPFSEETYTGYTWTGRKNFKGLIYSKAVFGDGILLDFEGSKIRCPQKYDEYLKQQFGDYMSFPPERERNSGHVPAVLDLNKSYRYYQEHGVPEK